MLAAVPLHGLRLLVPLLPESRISTRVALNRCTSVVFSGSFEGGEVQLVKETRLASAERLPTMLNKVDLQQLKAKAQAQARKLESSRGGDSAYARLGAERLRSIIEDFVARVVGDVMIGFMFREVDPLRLAELEFQMAARFLGAAEVTYQGRPLDKAHAPHRIMGGQFARRTQILRQTLTEHRVDDDIIADWMRHTERLRPLITGQTDGECVDPGPLSG